jgi:hypothetical protein
VPTCPHPLPSPVPATSRRRTPRSTTKVQPVASPTAVTSTQGAAQTLPVVATAGDPLVPLDPVATRLEALAGATVDVDGTVVVVPGEGRYELDRTAGTVLFTPGATATSTLTPSVTEVARPATPRPASTASPSISQ